MGSSEQVDRPAAWPLRWGVDDAGGPANLERQAWTPRLFRELGFDLWVMHYRPQRALQQNLAYIRDVDAWCEEHQVGWLANLEHANWIAHFVDQEGRDWFNHPDGRHYFQFPEVLLASLGRCKRLVGLMYDEAAHMQNCANMMAQRIDKPFIFDPRNRKLQDAAEAFVEAAAAVGAQHAAQGLRLYTEHVFPVMFHGFARAGYTAATKILKENWSPAYIACAMGAALQYDTELWITPDLWGMTGYPGHTVEEYRSALLLAYHMGADCIYTENLAYDHEKRGQGSLVYVDGHDYRVTPYGEVTRWFLREYVPAHPRHYSFRQLLPRVAIVRQEDACWGQGTSWLPDRLFGSQDWISGSITEAWLRLWHLLSRGVIAADSLSWHGTGYTGRPYQLFCPLDGVVVFDHRVSSALLAGAEMIFLTGLGISRETLAGVQQRVHEGAICISLPHLLPQSIVAQTGQNGTWRDGDGEWVATQDFLAPHVRRRVHPLLPAYDVLRYRFGDTTVTVRPQHGDPNCLAVEVN